MQFSSIGSACWHQRQGSCHCHGTNGALVSESRQHHPSIIGLIYQVIILENSVVLSEMCGDSIMSSDLASTEDTDLEEQAPALSHLGCLTPSLRRRHSTNRKKGNLSLLGEHILNLSQLKGLLATGQSCPALQDYLATHPKVGEDLFIYQNLAPLIQFLFGEVLKCVIGIVIQFVGKWKSLAYQSYVPGAGVGLPESTRKYVWKDSKIM